MQFQIDGDRFENLEGFFVEVGLQLIPGVTWGHNLDSFDEILGGGFGTPAEGFTIRWHNHSVSRHRLGYRETRKQLVRMLFRAHFTHWPSLFARCCSAALGRGPTVFDWLVEIIKRHGPGGSDAEDHVLLILE